MGGKARLRSWLLEKFPTDGRRYSEFFAGRGNVFFLARKKLNFKEWHLNDIDISFFKALLEADISLLPEKVEKVDFLYWKEEKSSLAKILEPRITFAGKGYKFGYNGSSGTHVGYNGSLYRILCAEAKRLLEGVSLTETCWADLDVSGYTVDDFVYLDPPYFGTVAQYPNIDHQALVLFLNSAQFRWALSGYDVVEYSTLKFKNRYEKVRNSEIKGSNSGQKEDVKEILWTNY